MFTTFTDRDGKFQLLALTESAFPMEVTRDLDTVGPVEFDGVLKTSFTAHPKFCHKTGEMLAFGYSFLRPSSLIIESMRRDEWCRA